MDRVIGVPSAMNQLSGALENSLKPDGSIETTYTVIMDAISNLGIMPSAWKLIRKGDVYASDLLPESVFGQIGGEEAADHPTEIQRGAVGAAGAFQKRFSEEELEVAFTIICGDNYFAEHTEEVLEEVRQFLEKEKPDLLIAGPAFNAGRYGMACGNMLKLAQQHLGIPAVSAMYEENPGMEMFRLYGYIFPSGPNARDMRKTMKKIGDFVEKLVKGCEIGSPKEEGYFPRGIRKMVWKEKSGAVRAVDMMLKKVRKEPFETELPMPKFDRIVPSPAIWNLSKARIAVMTSGGIVPKGNPDHMEALACTKYRAYTLEEYGDAGTLPADVAHGGFDPSFAMENGNRVLPVDVLEDFAKDGTIGELYPYFYVTVGNSMPVDRAAMFGQEIAKEIKGKVDGVILTST